MKAEDQIINIAHELMAIAQDALVYNKNKFDIEHYERVRELAGELLSVAVVDMTAKQAQEIFEKETGYQTPKMDTRAVIFNDKDEVLLIKDYDGKWALPGGWCEFDKTIMENTIKEAKEEAGLDVEPYRLVCAHSHRGHNNPDSFFHIIRFFMLCKKTGGSFEANSETTEAKYYALDSLPDNLNDHKCNPEQLKLCYKAYKATDWLPEID